MFLRCITQNYFFSIVKFSLGIFLQYLEKEWNPITKKLQKKCGATPSELRQAVFDKIWGNNFSFLQFGASLPPNAWSNKNMCDTGKHYRTTIMNKISELSDE